MKALDEEYQCKTDDEDRCWPEVRTPAWKPDEHIGEFLLFCRTGTPLVLSGPDVDATDKLRRWQRRIVRAQKLQAWLADQQKDFPALVKPVNLAPDGLAPVEPKAKTCAPTSSEKVWVCRNGKGYPVDKPKDKKLPEALAIKADELRELQEIGGGTRGLFASGAQAGLSIAVQGLAKFIEKRAQQEIELFVADKLTKFLCGEAEDASYLAAPIEEKVKTPRFWLPHTCSMLLSWKPEAGSGSLRWSTMREGLRADLRDFPVRLDKALEPNASLKPLRVALRVATTLRDNPSPQQMAERLADASADLDLPQLEAAATVVLAFMTQPDLTRIPEPAMLGVVRTLTAALLPIDDLAIRAVEKLVLQFDLSSGVTPLVQGKVNKHLQHLERVLTALGSLGVDVQKLTDARNAVKQKFDALVAATDESARKRALTELMSQLRGFAQVFVLKSVQSLADQGDKFADELAAVRTAVIKAVSCSPPDWPECIENLRTAVSAVKTRLTNLKTVLGKRIGDAIIELLDRIDAELRNIEQHVTQIITDLEGKAATAISEVESTFEKANAIISKLSESQHPDIFRRGKQLVDDLKATLGQLEQVCEPRPKLTCPKAVWTAYQKVPDFKQSIELWVESVKSIRAVKNLVKPLTDSKDKLTKLVKDELAKLNKLIEPVHARLRARLGNLPTFGLSTQELMGMLRSFVTAVRDVQRIVDQLNNGELTDEQRQAQQKLLVSKLLGLVSTAMDLVPGLDDYRLPDELPALVEAMLARDYDAALVTALRILADQASGSSIVPKKVVQGLSFAAEVVAAESPEDVRKAIEAVAAPVGSWREKRRPDGARLFISSLVGGFASGDVHQGLAVNTLPEHSWQLGLHASVGLEFLACRSERVPFSFYLSLLDLGGLVAVPFLDDSATEGDSITDSQDTSAETESTVDLRSVVAPGLFLRWGLGDSPFVAAIGAQYVPRASALEYTGTDGTAAEDLITALRFSVVFAVDVTIWAF